MVTSKPSSSEIDVQGHLTVVIFVGILIYVYVYPQFLAFYNAVLPFYSSLRDFYLMVAQYVLTRQTLFLTFLLFSPLLLYPIRKLKQSILSALNNRRNRIQYIKKEGDEIQHLLDTNPDRLTLEEMKEFVRNMQSKIELTRKIQKFTRFENLLGIQMADARSKLRELNENAKLEEFDFKKKKIYLEIKNLKEEREYERNKEKRILEQIASDLHMQKNNAFFKSSLYQEEIDILHENGYEDANEYDVLKRKIVPVLVKRIMNHTHTHTFLVWSVERFLTIFKEIKLLQHHDTKYPDITFTVDDLDYALEIETGPLLRKKRQAAAKVNFLNKHYPDRWMFIVSNKNLLSKYRKLGPATQRSEVEKAIKKMLGIPL